MTPHDSYSIKIHICRTALADISHKKMSKTPLSNTQDSKENNAIIQLFQIIYVLFT